MEFQIDIADKVARVIGAPIIVCGNDDYQVRFTFDAEWLSKTAKTARFKWTEGGENKHIDVPFTGSTVDVPVLSNITVVQIGVYAGDLQTTTPARVPCVKSILCGSGTHAAPTPDVYNQIIQLIENSAVQTPVTLAVEDRNSGVPVSIWLGTQEAFEALPETVENCIYFTTDGLPPVDIFGTLENHADTLDEITRGIQTVGKAESATTAGHATTADSATTAGHATTADSATTALEATRARNAEFLSLPGISWIDAAEYEMTVPAVYLVILGYANLRYSEIICLPNWAFNTANYMVVGNYVKFQCDRRGHGVLVPINDAGNIRCVMPLSTPFPAD